MEFGNFVVKLSSESNYVVMTGRRNNRLTLYLQFRHYFDDIFQYSKVVLRSKLLSNSFMNFKDFVVF